MNGNCDIDEFKAEHMQSRNKVAKNCLLWSLMFAYIWEVDKEVKMKTYVFSGINIFVLIDALKWSASISIAQSAMTQ